MFRKLFNRFFGYYCVYCGGFLWFGKPCDCIDACIEEFFEAGLLIEENFFYLGFVFGALLVLLFFVTAFVLCGVV